MTVVNQMLFKCNRCDNEIAVPTANTPPVQRISAEGWRTLFIDNVNDASHLCPGCNRHFMVFMEGGNGGEQD